MMKKLVVWGLIGGLLYYRNSTVVRVLAQHCLELGQYLGALACVFIKATLLVGKYVVRFAIQVYPHILVWAKQSSDIVRWHGQQLCWGLLGCTSGWRIFLSWTFLFSVVYLYCAHKFRTWWPHQSLAERNRQTDDDTVGIDSDRNFVGVRERGNFRNLGRFDFLGHGMEIEQLDSPHRRADFQPESYIPRRRTPIRNVAGGDNEMHMPDIRREQAANHPQQNSPTRQENRGAETELSDEEIASMTRRIEASLDARNCVVCFENEKNTAVFPCGHAQMCRQCAHKIQRSTNRCPICQHCIIEIRTIFI